MDWETIGALGNVIGVGAVVVSIVFLAIEVRHNTASNRLSTEKDIANAITTQIFLSTAATRLPHIYLRGTEDPSQLSEEEEGQFTFYVMGFLRLVQDVYDRYQEGNISARTWGSRPDRRGHARRWSMRESPLRSRRGKGSRFLLS